MNQPIKKSVALTHDHMKRVSSAKPLHAICELIWNSLDADATEIHVDFIKNALDGYEKIVVRDNGTGVSRKYIDSYLGYVGNSWKSSRHTTDKGRPIHGKKGEGRFKAFSLGGHITWCSVYAVEDTNYETHLLFHSDRLDTYDIHEEKETTQQTGLRVSVENLNKSITKLNLNDVYMNISQTFAFYLHCYPDVAIYIDGKKIDVSQEISHKQDYEFEVDGITGLNKLIIIEWENISSKSILLCKENGAVLKEYIPKPYKLRNQGYSFSAYLCSRYLDGLNEENSLELFELQPIGQSLIYKSLEIINQHFLDKVNQYHLERLARWKEDGIYPFDDIDDLSQIEVAKREIFDIVASKVEYSLPKFSQADTKTKRFTFKLLSQAIQNNPESLQTIITEVLNLPKDEQDAFAGILQKTTLSSIIKSAKIVADRLDFIAGLEELIFNHKKSLLERDQLHKILEHEAWVFDEQFALAGSERRLEEVLNLHLKHLGERADNLDDVVLSDGRTGRFDLMLSKADEIRAGEYDYLVVELKRPKQKITDEVIAQIKKYAYAVQDDPRFDKQRCRWKFIAISNEMDSYAKRERENFGGLDGCIYRANGLEIHILTWAEVITNAKARLKFYQEQLRYESNDETSLVYLKQRHAEFLPKTLSTSLTSSPP